MRLVFVVAMLQVAVATLSGQAPPPPDGPLVGLQLAFSIDPATAVGTAGTREAQPYWKRNGSRSSLPTPTSTVLTNFSPALVFGPYMAPPYPDIDAMSMGLDFIPANSFGQVEVDFGHWNFMVFSVRRGTAGEIGSAINAEVGTTGGNEADFFHYVFRGASCIPPEFIDRTFKLADSSEVRLPAPAEVDGADLMMTLYPLENVLTPSLGLPTCPTACPVVYYSFSAATLSRVPPAWWGGTPISGATIFSSTWTGLGWTMPAVAYTPFMLGLLDCEDVDGLAIDLYDPRGIQILFSTTSAGCMPRDQILFLQCPCDFALPVPLQYATGEPVSSRIGIDRSRRDDDVDAICIGDPICSGSHFWEPVKFERTIGYPWSGSFTFGFPRRLAVQALREPLPVGSGFSYTLFVTGGHPGGPGAWLIWDPVGYPFAAPLQLFFAVPTVSPFPGNPVQPVVTFPAALLGIDVVLQAATLDLALPGVNVSHALRVSLY